MSIQNITWNTAWKKNLPHKSSLLLLFLSDIAAKKKKKKIDKSMYDYQWPTCRYFVLLLPVTFLPFTYSASSAQYFRLIIFWVIFLVFTLQRVQGDQYPSLYHRRAHTINNPISIFNFYKAYFYTWHANTDTATVNIFIRIYYQFRFRW